MISKSKIIIIVGPTASGKTGLSLELAKKFNGEIISADSRQVYKEMNIGTAKVAGKKSKVKSLDCGCDFSAEGIPHHLIDIINPDQDFSVADFKERAEICIQEIIKRQKVPFIVGGTGFIGFKKFFSTWEWFWIMHPFYIFFMTLEYCLITLFKIKNFVKYKNSFKRSKS
jgi:tRNA dimethylallyltransferase